MHIGTGGGTDMWVNAAWFEVVFLLLAVVGTILSAWRTLLAWKDYQSAEGSDELQDIGLLNLATAGTVLLLQAFYVLVGAASVYLPPAGRPSSDMMTDRQFQVWVWIWFIRGGFLLTTLLLDLNSLLALLIRYRIRNEWRRRGYHLSDSGTVRRREGSCRHG
jgi:hypothetical protein